MAATTPANWTLPRLAIDRDGAWFHDGEEVTHAGVLANLRDNLRADADGYFLTAGPVRVPVEVEDTPFVVLRVEREGDQLIATVNDLTREPLPPATLSFRADSAPYCRVKGGLFDARLTRAAAYQLFQYIEYDEAEDVAVLVVGNGQHRLPKPAPRRAGPEAAPPAP
jgi:hypothetical protein